MALDDSVIVKIDGGEINMGSPALNDWVMFERMEKESIDKQAELLFSKVIHISNVRLKNGEEITLENVKQKEVPVVFFFLLKNLWIKELVNKGLEIAGKNA